jgi:3-deoxy-D-manno-octulosonate 8-phosphate phosphatase (KDO 8-P phosphatase)
LDFDNVKIVISEFDGIITRGDAAFGEINSVLFKAVCLKDFEAINLIKKGWGFVFLSSDPIISSSLCKKRNIPFFYAERDKAHVYSNILQRHGLVPDQVLYIGNSYSDIECIRLSGFSVCPEDAPGKVKNVVDHVSPILGGEGFLCYVYELLDLNKSRDV